MAERSGQLTRTSNRHGVTITTMDKISNSDIGQHVNILENIIASEPHPSKEWNQWRKLSGIENPELQYLKIENANFKDIDFNGVNLTGAELKDADFSGANLIGATLNHANLEGAKFIAAKLLGVDALKADFWSANFTNANLRGVDLTDSNCRDAQFHGAILINAIFDRAELHITRGMRLDHTSIRGAHFDHDSDDPWSVLRRSYTGSMLAFQLLFSIIFFAPFIAKTFFWVAISSYQNVVSHPNLFSCASTECIQTKGWKVLLGLHDGWFYFIAVILMLMYNIIRLFLTFHVSRLRDGEERSGRSPLWEPLKVKEYSHEFEKESKLNTLKSYWLWLKHFPTGYSKLYEVHRVANVFFIVSVAIFIFNLYHWLSVSINLPT